MSDNEGETQRTQTTSSSNSTSTASMAYPRSAIPVPHPMDMKGDLALKWSIFREQYEDYEIATKLDKETQPVRVATLKSVMGKATLQIFKHLGIPSEARENTTQILDALEAHFAPSRNVIYERYVFHSTNQGETETIDQYVTKLRELASTCNFGTLTEEMIRDRIVLGTNNAGLQGRLLRESKLTLKSAVDMCRSSEASQKQQQKLRNSKQNTSEEVHFSKRDNERKSRVSPPKKYDKYNTQNRRPAQ